MADMTNNMPARVPAHREIFIHFVR